MCEFDLIQRYFTRNTLYPSAVATGIGDDCALLVPTPSMQLAISSDMLVEGRHFLSTVSPEALGHKALAVNLSDLAACGAQPVAFTLALALPRVDTAWLEDFSRGLFALADAHRCSLIGGDTTQGALNICITVIGQVPVVNGRSQALLRSGAQPGDDIYVSGHLGDARLALEVFRGTIRMQDNQFAIARERMERPTPRVALGMALRGVASAAIDVSDGLLGDLGHILELSRVGADIAIDIVASCSINTMASTKFSKEFARKVTAAGGDDYELLFTAAPSQRAAVLAASEQTATRVSRIGSVRAEPGVRLFDAQGQTVEQVFSSFEHFKTD